MKKKLSKTTAAGFFETSNTIIEKGFFNLDIYRIHNKGRAQKIEKFFFPCNQFNEKNVIKFLTDRYGAGVYKIHNFNRDWPHYTVKDFMIVTENGNIPDYKNKNEIDNDEKIRNNLMEKNFKLQTELIESKSAARLTDAKIRREEMEIELYKKEKEIEIEIKKMELNEMNKQSVFDKLIDSLQDDDSTLRKKIIDPLLPAVLKLITRNKHDN